MNLIYDKGEYLQVKFDLTPGGLAMPWHWDGTVGLAEASESEVELEEAAPKTKGQVKKKPAKCDRSTQKPPANPKHKQVRERSCIANGEYEQFMEGFISELR